MATPGCLGDVIFTVSKEQVETVNSLVWKSSAKWGTLDRHLQSPLLEYSGMDADEIQLSIHLSGFLGVDPMDEITRLFKYEREGTLLPLVLGEHAYGKYRWVIISTEREASYFDGAGNLLVADVTLQLKGYVK
jgi:hypothetical protein